MSDEGGKEAKLKKTRMIPASRRNRNNCLFLLTGRSRTWCNQRRDKMGGGGREAEMQVGKQAGGTNGNVLQ